MRDLVINFILNTADVIIIYYLYCGLTNIKRDFSKKKIIIGLVYGFIAGLCINYLRDDLSRVIIYLGIFAGIYLFSRKEVYKALLLFMLVLICVATIQVSITLLLFPFTLDIALQMLIVQFISVFIVIIICNKFPIHKLLYVLERELILTLFFFILLDITFSIFFFKKFKFIALYSGCFIIITIISLAGIYKTITKIYFYTNKLPLIRHEMENALAGVYLSVNSTDDLNKIREDFNEYFSIIGINPGKSSIKTNDKNRIFNDFIQYKKQEKLGLKKLYFDTKINYYEPHAKISEPAMIIMLGILLDNAIQMSANGKTIKINIRVTEEYLVIEVANVLLQSVGQDFLKIFEKGYTTKKQDSEIHGYGLSKLSEVVSRYGGEILIREEYIKADRTDYIFITTEFK